ncbi:hypothetical protein [Kamptonema formosum]|uniref:hypothetical protein n=1 Tax=Kamptonema formosum TaxID=331992 RepID=UPI00034837C9|nr:hypothetical protein [Oscillatoria sp. PCC 10802]
MAARLSDFSAASVRVSQTSFPQTFRRHAASSRFDISFPALTSTQPCFMANKLKAATGNVLAACKPSVE